MHICVIHRKFTGSEFLIGFSHSILFKNFNYVRLLLLLQDVQFKRHRLLVYRCIELIHFKQINRYIICCHNSFYNNTNYSPQKGENTGQ